MHGASRALAEARDARDTWRHAAQRHGDALARWESALASLGAGPSRVRRFLEAVASRPPTWRIILLPLDGTPEVVRDHVETNRARTQKRIEHLVGVAVERADLPKELDVELVARAIRCLGEEAGRTLLTDPERYSPER